MFEEIKRLFRRTKTKAESNKKAQVKGAETSGLASDDALMIATMNMNNMMIMNAATMISMDTSICDTNISCDCGSSF